MCFGKNNNTRNKNRRKNKTNNLMKFQLHEVRLFLVNGKLLRPLRGSGRRRGRRRRSSLLFTMMMVLQNEWDLPKKLILALAPPVFVVLNKSY